ncbi:MAG TPA: NAD-dependent epimerase/dehydratase family protein [Chitinispirillaceae bacterium]|nr:NAD-dependent epimerase/dehydratase family protein [Fibrobacter sp.]HLV33321.1 NAD-dependent epimerase/dehydratase family protein [Chitinispirillaceae bacterium]
MITITGAAGFIGYHVCLKLLDSGEHVIGIDNINNYYDPALKEARLSNLKKYENFHFFKVDICDFEKLGKIFTNFKPQKICHLAAQAGVRYSLTNPFAYQKSNNEGFLNMLEIARKFNIHNFVYASSSSVYGGNTKLPFSESDPVEKPISLYAATKRSNELTAHCYNHLYGIPCSGLRFFTVYGPWGRPDMALFIFTKAIVENKPVKIFNNGKMIRNFTYIDDIVDGVIRVINNPKPYEIYNIGNDKAENLMDFISEIEKNIGKKAIREFAPIQPGDVVETVADISKIKELGYVPETNIDSGIKNFISWYNSFYKT